MLTRKGIALVSLSALAMFTGLVYGDIEPVVLSAFIFGYFLYNLCISRPSLSSKRKRDTNDAIEGDRVCVSTTVENEGRGIVIEVQDALDEKCRLRGMNRACAFVGRNARLRIAYEVEVKKRGRYSIGPIRYRAYDPAGVSFDEGEISDVSDITVFPKMEDARSAEVESGFFRHYPGEYLTRQSGSSTQFRTIRDYVRGDPIKRINWKASRRFDKWMVNDYERDNICDIVMFLDARQVSAIGSGMINPLENSIRALATMAALLIKGHNQVGLVIYSDGVYMLPPAGGSAQLQRILSALTFVEAKGHTRFISAVENAEGYLSPKTGLLLFSSLDYDPTVRNAAHKLNAKGYELTIISPSSVDFERMFAGYVTDRYEMVRMERDNLLEELAGFSVKVIDWLPNEDIYAMLRRVSDE